MTRRRAGVSGIADGTGRAWRAGVSGECARGMAAGGPACGVATMVSNREELFDELRTILVQMFELDAADVVPGARLYEDLDIDSIDAVDLVIRLRELTGTRVDPEDFRSVRTVQDVVDTTARLLATA